MEIKRLRNTPTLYDKISYKTTVVDFPGSALDKNPPAKAGGTDSIPGPGRLHVPGSTCPMCHHQRPCSGPTATATEAMLLEPVLCNKVSHCGEKPTPSSRSALLTASRGSLCTTTETRCSRKLMITLHFKKP